MPVRSECGNPAKKIKGMPTIILHIIKNKIKRIRHAYALSDRPADHFLLSVTGTGKGRLYPKKGKRKKR